MVRKSLRAVSKLRAESHDVRATTKNPMMAGTLGTRSTEIAITEMMAPLKALKIKLDHGTSNMLDMIIGIVKANRLRPLDTCSGVSLSEKTRVKKARKMVDASRPDQKMLIK